MNTSSPEPVKYTPPPPIETIPTGCYYIDSYPVIYTQQTQYFPVYQPSITPQNTQFPQTFGTSRGIGGLVTIVGDITQNQIQLVEDNVNSFENQAQKVAEERVRAGCMSCFYPKYKK